MQRDEVLSTTNTLLCSYKNGIHGHTHGKVVMAASQRSLLYELMMRKELNKSINKKKQMISRESRGQWMDINQTSGLGIFFVVDSVYRPNAANQIVHLGFQNTPEIIYTKHKKSIYKYDNRFQTNEIQISEETSIFMSSLLRISGGGTYLFSRRIPNLSPNLNSRNRSNC